jgi:hypothetical protein
MTSSIFPFVIDFLCQQRDVEVEVEVEVVPTIYFSNKKDNLILHYLNKLVVYRKVFSHVTSLFRAWNQSNL